MAIQCFASAPSARGFAVKFSPASVLDGKLRFFDRLQDRLGYDVTLPEKAGHPIRLIDLVTQTSGLPREVPRPDGPPNDPFGTNTKEAQIADLKNDPLLFSPGTAALYSNYGFDLLGAALAHVATKPAIIAAGTTALPRSWIVCAEPGQYR